MVFSLTARYRLEQPSKYRGPVQGDDRIFFVGREMITNITKNMERITNNIITREINIITTRHFFLPLDPVVYDELLSLKDKFMCFLG